MQLPNKEESLIGYHCEKRGLYIIDTSLIVVQPLLGIIFYY